MSLGTGIAVGVGSNTNDVIVAVGCGVTVGAGVGGSDVGTGVTVAAGVAVGRVVGRTNGVTDGAGVAVDCGVTVGTASRACRTRASIVASMSGPDEHAVPMRTTSVSINNACPAVRRDFINLMPIAGDLSVHAIFAGTDAIMTCASTKPN